MVFLKLLQIKRTAIIQFNGGYNSMQKRIQCKWKKRLSQDIAGCERISVHSHSLYKATFTVDAYYQGFTARTITLPGLTDLPKPLFTSQDWSPAIDEQIKLQGYLERMSKVWKMTRNELGITGRVAQPDSIPNIHANEQKEDVFMLTKNAFKISPRTGLLVLWKCVMMFTEPRKCDHPVSP
jgi:hypothetical protein